MSTRQTDLKTKRYIIRCFSAFFCLIGISSCKPSHYEYEAKADVNNIRNAIMAFKIEYGYYPVDVAHVTNVNLKIVLPVLHANPDSEIASKLNTNGINYLGNIPVRRFNDGCYLDPWGSPFNLMLTTTNTSVETIKGNTVYDNVAVWSNGKNRKNEFGNGDDICSWKDEPRVQFWNR